MKNGLALTLHAEETNFCFIRLLKEGKVLIGTGHTHLRLK